MSCPCFEPQSIVAHRQYVNARLPLIDEYDGLCRAFPEAVTAPADMRFRYCNHGYSKGCCQRLPVDDPRSSLRYDVVGRSETALSLLCIEERDHAPLRWRAIQYVLANGCLEPELNDVCLRAQALAFCHSYLSRLDAPAAAR